MLERHIETIASGIYPDVSIQPGDQCTPIGIDTARLVTNSIVAHIAICSEKRGIKIVKILNLSHTKLWNSIFRYSVVRKEEFHELVEEEVEDARRHDPSEFADGQGTLKDLIDVQRNEDLIRRADAVPRIPEYEDMSHFLPHWEDDMRLYQSNLLDINKILQPKFKVWFDRCDNSKDPLCAYRCRWCMDFFKAGNRADIRQKKNIQTPNGILHKSKYENNRELENHLSNPVHLAARKHKFEQASEHAENEYSEVSEAFDSSDAGYYQATINMFKLIYTETITNTPFHRHPLFVDLLRDLKVNIGKYHSNDKAAATMTRFISAQMHESLIKSLIECNLPFSLIVDGTTDKHNTNIRAQSPHFIFL